MDTELHDQWVAAIKPILEAKDSRGRWTALRSELDSCIIGIRSFQTPIAQRLLTELTERRAKARTEPYKRQ